MSIGGVVIPGDRHLRQFVRFLQRLSASIVPVVHVIQKVREGQHCVGLGKLRIEVDGPFQQRARFFDTRSAALKNQLSSTQIVVISIEVVGALVRDTPLLALVQLQRQGRDDLPRHLILHGEDVGEVAVVPLGLHVAASRAVDELSGDPHPVSRLADASFQHIANRELPGHLLHPYGLAAVGEG